jgi:glycerol kinase
MQLQADTGGRAVARSLAAELSALGVAHLAGRVAGVWTQDQLEALDRPRELYEPAEPAASRHARVAAWHAAVARARHQEETAHAAL